MREMPRITITKDREGKPLAIVDGLPGDGAELRPAELRAVAKALLEAAREMDPPARGLDR
jgi:hypothetical protein